MTIVHVFDTETAGLQGGVCDIAIVAINDRFEVVDAWDSLIDPERPISPEAMGVHHITEDMVKGKPTLTEFMAMSGHPFNAPDLVLAGHNVAFDLRMVHETLPAQYRKICTLKLARAVWPDAESHKLQTLRYKFGLKAGDAHRAMGDVVTCISLMRQVCNAMNWTLADLIGASNQPISLDTRLSFGKHKGTKMRDLPKSYLTWALREMKDLDPDLKAAFQAVLYS